MGFKQEFSIGNKWIGQRHSTFIIGEAGVNHNGDISIAKKLIDVAISAGVDAVKFQSFKPEELILKSVEKAAYQKETTGNAESQFEMLQKLRIDVDQTFELKRYAESNGIIFMTTPFDEFSLHELDELELSAYKISSTDFTNVSFVETVAKKGKPIIISCAMSYLDEVQYILNRLEPINVEVVLLHCTANYPTPETEVNLRVLDTLSATSDVLLGYSDHTKGIGASPYAVALGAHVIEKHFTLDKSMDGPDHEASLDPAELKEFVAEIRKVEKLMGSGEKIPTVSESNTRQKLQKCIVAAQPIAKGAEFSPTNIIARRTGGEGISAIRYYELLGMKATQQFSINDIIRIDE